MARSRSQSPRWGRYRSEREMDSFYNSGTYGGSRNEIQAFRTSSSPTSTPLRSLSSVPRKSEYYYKGRYSHRYHEHDYRKDSKRPTSWSMSTTEHGQNKPRISSYENTYYQFCERRSPSPYTRGSYLDDFYPYNPYQVYSQVYSPGRKDDNTRFQYNPQYSEDVYYSGYWCNYYSQQEQGRYNPDDYYRVRNTRKVGEPHHRSRTDAFRFEGECREDEFGYQRIRDDKYSQSLQRSSEAFHDGSSFQKRYPEDREYRKYEHTSRRPPSMESYEVREHSGSPPWMSWPSLPPFEEKKDQWHHTYQTYQAYQHAHRKPPRTGSATKVYSDFRRKRLKTSDGYQDFFYGRTQKHSRDEERECISLNSSISRESSKLADDGGRKEIKDEQVKDHLKPFKKDYFAFTRSNKSDVGLRNSKQRQKANKEKSRTERTPSSNRLGDSKPSNVKTSSASLRKKSVVFKIDEEKTDTSSTVSSETKRQMPHDLVPVGSESEDFQRMSAHLDSTKNTENKPPEEFAKEIVTVIHQIKATYFSSPAITLHERFSKIQPTQAADVNEIKSDLEPVIHRRLDLSLAEPQNRQSMVCGSEQTLVNVIDPNDLRHDIERRRKERLQKEDEPIFHIASAAESKCKRLTVPRKRILKQMEDNQHIAKTMDCFRMCLHPLK
ncbi:BCLAF1 and THRAP3 family member 3 isoform X1 [Saccopteryx leptura]|uniref:BCLAF1 and THRAP3 family member 3 isoform X1 n=1 Tax=Saccopteryx leptura TaxID=249018 RepID=UPI00339C9DF3